MRPVLWPVFISDVWVFSLSHETRSLKISNQQARHIAIHSSGLHYERSITCGNTELLALIQYLGYVQQDPIQVVARAHDHIVWSRNERYEIGQIDNLLKDTREIFEHFSHDACVLPISMLPYWRIQFTRKALLKQFKGAGKLLLKSERQAMLARIEQEGPLCSRDFQIAVKKTKGKRAIWTKPLHKKTLDYFWLTGVLAVSKREKFTKYYDLSERILPSNPNDFLKSDIECIDWLANHAIDRLGFASYIEIKGFWDACSLEEIKQWHRRNAPNIAEVSIESFNGGVRVAFARKAAINHPLIRNRKRLMQLFGFDYRIEMYVPPDERQYGYYVYPLLEYDTFVGRLEVKHDRERNALCVHNLWSEPGVKFGKVRMQKLHSELERLRKFCQASHVQWCD